MTSLKDESTVDFDLEVEENYLNLFTYLRRRYPDTELDSKPFLDLIRLKNSLEGPRSLALDNGELAAIIKRWIAASINNSAQSSYLM